MMTQQQISSPEFSLPPDIMHERGENFIFSARKLVEDAIRQSGILQDGRNADWLEAPSIQASLIFLAYLYGAKKTRKRGGQWASVHQIRGAHNMANESKLLRGIISEQRVKAMAYFAFVFLHHDTPEDSKKLGFDPDGALDCILTYIGKNLRAVAREDILLVTDKVEGAARMPEQIRLVADLPRHLQYLKVYDKIDQVEGDDRFYKLCLKHIGRGGVPREEIESYVKLAEFDYDKAVDRLSLVQAAFLVESKLLNRYDAALVRLRKKADILYRAAQQAEAKILTDQTGWARFDDGLPRLSF